MPTVDLDDLEPVEGNPFDPQKGFGTLSAGDPSWGERISGAFSNAMGYLGATPQGQRNAYNFAQTGAGLIPGVNNAISANQAYRDWQQGNYLGAGVNAISAAIPPVPGANTAERTLAGALAKEAEPIGGRVMMEGGTPGILAYHASRHDFPKFDINAINTGEATQDEGWGLYFAQHPDVAETYRNVGAQPGFRNKETGEMLGAYDDPAMAAIFHRIEPNETWESLSDKIMKSRDFSNQLMANPNVIKPAYWQEENRIYNKAAEMLPEWQKGFYIDPGTTSAKGYKYQVSIAHDPDTFLDLNKTFDQQPQNVQKALIRSGFNPSGQPKDLTGLDIHNDLTNNFLHTDNPHAALADSLSKNGVPGIKYLDDYSEQAGPFDNAGTLGDQSPSAQKKIMKLLPDAKPDDEISHLHGEYGDQLFDKAIGAAGNDEGAVTDAWTHDHSGDAAQAFMKAGVKANSGATHNYVIFSDKNINILKKYGIAGGAGLMGAIPMLHQHGDVYQMQEQTD